MAKKTVVPPELPTPAAPAVERDPGKEYTEAPVQGGAYDGDGTLVHQTGPEPDGQRMAPPAPKPAPQE